MAFSWRMIFSSTTRKVEQCSKVRDGTYSSASSVRSVLVDTAISCSTNQDHGASDLQKSLYCGQGVGWPQWKLALSGRRQPSNHKAD